MISLSLPANKDILWACSYCSIEICSGFLLQPHLSSHLLRPRFQGFVGIPATWPQMNRLRVRHRAVRTSCSSTVALLASLCLPILQNALPPGSPPAPDLFVFRLLLHGPIMSSRYPCDSTFHVHGGNKASFFAHPPEYAWKIFLF